ncbi:MAG: hypothetical protein GY742_09145 [Hyphomicrobiales bacterium]|nr:hypothetical protein [Hyphomicrobiales bacterium]
MKISGRYSYLPLALGLIVTVAIPAGIGLSEPVLNQVLSTATITAAGRGNCPVLNIGFNFRIGYISHFPRNGSSELHIRVKLLDRIEAAQNIKVPRESVAAPAMAGVNIKAIDFEANGSGPMLSVYFAETVRYSVRQGSDFTTIAVRIAGDGASAKCLEGIAMQSPTLDNRDDRGTRNAGTPTEFGSSSIPPTVATGTSVDQLIIQAREAVTRKQYRLAIRILTKLTIKPSHKHSAEALELLGVVRERNGQFAHAKAEYKLYLKKYPNGKGAQRIRQRLAALATSEAKPKRKLRKVVNKHALPKDNQKVKDSEGGLAVVNSEILPDNTDRQAGEEKVQEDPSVYKKEFRGSISQFYYRNQAFTRLRELQSRRVITDDEVYQNSLITSLDMTGIAENNAFRFKWRVSGSHGMDMNQGMDINYRLSSLMAEVDMKEVGTFVRVGRQTRNAGGVYGRFDGGLVSLQKDKNSRLNFFVGSPVDSSRNQPYKHQRIFYGASVDFENLYNGWDVTFFGMEQRAEGFLDRRAIGMEFQRMDENTSIFGNIDYDIYFNRINSALVSGTYIFGDYSTFSASADYVHSPYLSLSNALIGQSVDSLSALEKIYPMATIEELTLDRTSESMSANIVYSWPINEMWQATVDGTVFHTSGKPASGGVAATPSPGTEYFTSAQVVGSGVFKTGDIVSATARYANAYSSNLYMLDAYWRVPYTKKMRLRPRLKVGYRDLKMANGSEIFIIPSIVTDYEITRDKSFEVELGGRWSNRNVPSLDENNTEAYIIAGYRYEF